MKIAMVASEAAPFVKTGGLGDVLQALPQALSEIKNNEVSVFIPFYDRIKYSGKYDVEFLGYFDVPLAWRREYVGLLRLKSRRKKLKIYFIDNEHYFCRGCVYGCADDGERYAYFAKAALASMAFIGLQPDVVHCHDWQAALVPLLLKTEYRESFPNTRSVFTIHNIEYQGKANLSFNYDVIGLPRECDEILRFDDCTNLMKAAIVTADQVSTVSQTYCQELRYPYYAHGMSQVLSSRGGDFTGITNGIDMKLFNPMTTAGLAAHYNEKTFHEGKVQNKLALQKELGLPEDRDTAMLAMVTRLAGHKGIDLLCYIAERLMTRRVQLVVIGTGRGKVRVVPAGAAGAVWATGERQPLLQRGFGESCLRSVRSVSDAVEVGAVRAFAADGNALRRSAGRQRHRRTQGYSAGIRRTRERRTRVYLPELQRRRFPGGNRPGTGALL